VNTSERIRAEQIKSIYRNASPGMMATLLAVIMLSGLLVHFNVANPTQAIVFVCAMSMQTLARLVLYRRYATVDPALDQWRKWAMWFTAGTVVGAATTGGGVIWMVFSAGAELQLVALLLVFAVSSGAVGAYGVYLPTFYAFFVSISVAPVLWLFSRGDVLHMTLGGMYLLWFVAVAEQARRSNQVFVDSLRLRFENVDLVESLKLEKAAADQANTAKSRFLAAASHDLRQPVHALSLFVEAMRSRTMDDEARELLKHIDGSVKAMGGLFGGLLDISRLDAGVVEVYRTDFPIQSLLERVCRDYQSQAHDKGIELRLHRCSLWVRSDSVLLERIVRNLIANAVKYTNSGRIVIGCRRGKHFKVQVWDTGRGIPKSEQPMIFQEFYQLDNPERDRNKGVGLGLAIVKRLTTLLDHPLRLQSSPGNGSVFSIDVPVVAAQLSGSYFRRESDASPVQLGTGLILVIDDEPSIRTAMQSLLHSWGYEAIVAASGDEMLSLLATRRDIPKLIICDYRLRAHEKGIEVIERLRSEYNEDIPGMLITGDTAPDRLKEAQESSFLLLHKPVPNAKLRAAIAHLVGVAAAQERV